MFLKRLFLLFLPLTLVGCSFMGRGPQGTEMSAVRQQPPTGLKVVEMQISKQQLLAAVGRGSPTNDIRLVQVFKGQSDGGGGPPEYRFFEVKPKSSYALIGLKTADVLVAAHDYVVYDPQKFANYVAQYLPYMPEGSVEILRDGQPLRFKYTLVE